MRKIKGEKIMLKTISYFWLAVIVMISLFGCGFIQFNDDESAAAVGKIISRRLGVVAADRHPILASQIEPIATAILESAASGDDLLTILKKGLAETPRLDPLTKRDMQDLLELVEFNNVPEVYTEIAGAFLEGLAIYQNVK